MALYALGDREPDVDPTAYVHPMAVVIGSVTIGPESSVWPGAVLRGDYGTIKVGAGTSIQDGTVIHAGPGFPTTIGDRCVVGHLTHLEGCTLEDESLAGSGSVVLHWAVISHGATVGANAVVPNRMIVPPGALSVKTAPLVWACETKVVSGGCGSLRVTVRASLGPLFVTVIV